ncbi:uncharacterized protein BDV17DRAFT_246224 [Aspergillus undulatus]|uniref:uncharacterized protein n=1 Tax=Aspergillus undulatus TaxID=1810928 RepID=UPI003CCE2885
MTLQEASTHAPNSRLVRAAERHSACLQALERAVPSRIAGCPFGCESGGVISARELSDLLPRDSRCSAPCKTLLPGFGTIRTSGFSTIASDLSASAPNACQSSPSMRTSGSGISHVCRGSRWCVCTGRTRRRRGPSLRLHQVLLGGDVLMHQGRGYWTMKRK